MNTLEFIENKIPLTKSYYRLKEVECLVYHTQLRRMESSTNLWILNKNKVNSIEEAMLVQILVDEMKFGNYHYTEKDEIKVWELNLNILKEKYTYQLIPNIEKSLESLFEDYNIQSDMVTMNYDWSNQIDIQVIKNEPCFSELTIKSFKLIDVWNDIDYVFETENYYVRFNWGTAA